MKSIAFGKVEVLDYSVNEAYKSLRTNLKFCGADVKVIMLTSSLPDEGKSTLIFNLARSLAEDDKKVVLIDADMRKSVFIGRHKVESKHAIKGLSHYLSGQQAVEDVIYSTNIENLDMVFAGSSTPNPTELLSNQNFEELIRLCKENYDYIIIDAPPLGAVIDAAIITRVIDGAILVIENNKISRKFAQDVKRQLEKAECKMLGVVLNKVNLAKDKYYSKKYYKYYNDN